MPEKSRGRPPFKPTLKQRELVEQMRYCAEPVTVIARAIGIDEDTLKKHFHDELADGHANRRGEVVGYLFDAAKKGNVTAQKKLEEMGRGVGAAESARSVEPKTGKKAAAQADADAAVAAGGRFSTRTAPRLAVVGGAPVEEG
jgi:hypothetical protein